MFSLRALLVRHGYAFVFAYVLAVQSGLPIPADPMLLVMGAMVGEHRYLFSLSILATAAGALLGDALWYELGRRRGHSILGLVCRLSLEPDTCVRKTRTSFDRRGAATLLIAKFVPGLSLVSVPMAGLIRMPRWKFLVWDFLGVLLWGGAYLAVGAIFHTQVQAVVDLISSMGRGAGLFLVVCLVCYLGFKYQQRQRLVHDLRVNRILPEELLSMLKEDPGPFIVDLRHPAEIAKDNLKIVGALILRPDELRSRSREIPRDQKIILYCT